MIAAAVLLGLLAAPAFAGPGDRAVDEVRQALRRRDYPWYDKERDAPRLTAPEREDGRRKFGFWVEQLIMAAVLLAIGVSLTVALLKLSAYAARQARASEGALKPVRGRGRGASVRGLATPAGEAQVDHLAAAREAAAGGDYRGAVVHLFNHQLSVMDGHGLLRLHPARTNRQYLREVRDPLRRDLFRRSVRTFEVAAFSGRPVGGASYEEAHSVFEELRRNLAEDATAHVVAGGRDPALF